MVTARRKSRILALQTLFEVDSTAHNPELVLKRLLEEKSLPDGVVSFAREIVSGVLGSGGELDRIIQTYAPTYPVRQLAIIDRNILRIALFELSIQGKEPLKAVINEAVELAKTFGGESSSKFVNGVLGSVSRAPPSEGT